MGGILECVKCVKGGNASREPKMRYMQQVRSLRTKIGGAGSTVGTGLETRVQGGGRGCILIRSRDGWRRSLWGGCPVWGNALSGV